MDDKREIKAEGFRLEVQAVIDGVVLAIDVNDSEYTILLTPGEASTLSALLFVASEEAKLWAARANAADKAAD